MSVKRNARTGAWECRWRQDGRQRSRSFKTEKLAVKHDVLIDELQHAGHLDGLSVERAADGAAWEVRWTDQRLGRHRRPFPTKRDASAFERVIIESRRLGRPTDRIDVGTQTVGEYMVESWTPQHFVHLQPNSQRIYRALWRRHLRDTFEDLPLRDVSAAAIRRWQQDRVATGAGLTSVNQALVLLGGILQRAVQDEQIPTNPARIVSRLRTPKAAAVQPFSPAVVERVRREARDQFDATLISVLAYAGLRPSEAWALRWGDLRERTLLVQRATDGEGGVKSTKTMKVRTVKLLAPLVQDLAEWRIAQGRPGDSELIFPSRRRRSGVADMDEQAAWRKHRWGPAWKAAAARHPVMGQKPPRVYALRHSFVSLLLAAGRQPHYVAQQLGHDASQTISTYGHVLDEYAAGDDFVHVDPETKIREAREAVCATSVRPAQNARGAA
jgi:integrase